MVGGELLAARGGVGVQRHPRRRRAAGRHRRLVHRSRSASAARGPRAVPDRDRGRAVGGGRARSRRGRAPAAVSSPRAARHRSRRGAAPLPRGCRGDDFDRPRSAPGPRGDLRRRRGARGRGRAAVVAAPLLPGDRGGGGRRRARTAVDDDARAGARDRRAGGDPSVRAALALGGQAFARAQAGGWTRSLMRRGGLRRRREVGGKRARKIGHPSDVEGAPQSGV
ncbi:protein of unknown function [Microbacterium sp. Nx66]|nr:protein of unknown function [Microbacterium sp. Nx66]